MSSEWTDELKAQIIKEYQAAEPTSENSMEIVKNLADEHEKPVNGVRMILSQANVYVKKAAATKAGGGDKPKRVSKQDSIDSLVETLEGLGLNVDESITEKLTGKAAIYFKDLFVKVTSNED